MSNKEKGVEICNNLIGTYNRLNNKEKYQFEKEHYQSEENFKGNLTKKTILLKIKQVKLKFNIRSIELDKIIFS